MGVRRLAGHSSKELCLEAIYRLFDLGQTILEAAVGHARVGCSLLPRPFGERVGGEGRAREVTGRREWRLRPGSPATRLVRCSLAPLGRGRACPALDEGGEGQARRHGWRAKWPRAETPGFP